MAAKRPALVAHYILEIVRGMSYEGVNVETKDFSRPISVYIVHIHPHRFCIDWVNFFWGSTNGIANLSLGTGMGFSYYAHLVIKPKTYSFGWIYIYLIEQAI